MRRALIGIGHSHLAALRDAYYEQCAQHGPPADYSIDFQHITHFRNDIGQTVRTGFTSLPDNVASAIADSAAEPVLFFSLMGAEYFFLGVALHPRKFDFVLPERPELAIEDDAEIISPALVESAMRLECDCSMDFIAFTRSKVQPPFYFYGCPPPIRDSAFLSNVGHLRDRIAETGVTSAEFRLKLWLLQDRIYREGCEAQGVTYIAAPAETKDEDGFLLPEYWNDDGFHGNAQYGQVMLRHVVRSILSSERPV